MHWMIVAQTIKGGRAPAGLAGPDDLLASASIWALAVAGLIVAGLIAGLYVWMRPRTDAAPQQRRTP